MTTRRIDPVAIAQEKKRAIARDGRLEWFNPIPGGLSGVGGLENLETWLLSRSLALTRPEARAYRLPTPKGALLVGISGCGKSLSREGDRDGVAGAADQDGSGCAESRSTSATRRPTCVRRCPRSKRSGAASYWWTRSRSRWPVPPGTPVTAVCPPTRWVRYFPGCRIAGGGVRSRDREQRREVAARVLAEGQIRRDLVG